MQVFVIKEDVEKQISMLASKRPEGEESIKSYIIWSILEDANRKMEFFFDGKLNI